MVGVMRRELREQCCRLTTPVVLMMRSGGRTRTLNNWTRTSRVTDYTTPERWLCDADFTARTSCKDSLLRA